MDSKYIRENGLLELYLFGELSEERAKAVESALKDDASLSKELYAMESDLESIAMENAIQPPAAVKQQLMASVETDQPITTGGAKVIPLQDKRTLKIPFYAAAAVAAILLINSVWLYTQWQNSEQRLQTLEMQSEGLQEQLAGLKSDLNETSEWYSLVNDPEVEKLIMRGNTKSPNSVAVAYLNTDDEFVVLKTDGLEELPEDKTYQMWADVDGEMIDMGVIPREKDMVKLSYIANAESFNITIEPAGGNDHPTVEKLITNVIL
ncbi:MAG: anti-sigma factor [Flavobacteriaceae bacterium]|nr:anti-sigma factor [Bacteroidia bacterium]NNK86786.1 anti-sigma factor [Flavobacteriaceae bacterium]